MTTDEVESLTAARAGAMAGTEPSDALRVCFFTVWSQGHFSSAPFVGRQRSADPAGQVEAQEELSGHGDK